MGPFSTAPAATAPPGPAAQRLADRCLAMAAKARAAGAVEAPAPPPPAPEGTPRPDDWTESAARPPRAPRADATHDRANPAA